MKKLNENAFLKKTKIIKEESNFSNILSGNEQQFMPKKLSLADKYMVALHTRKALTSSGLLNRLSYFVPGGKVKEAANFINYLQTKDPKSYMDYVLELKKNQQNPEALKPVYSAILQYYEQIRSTTANAANTQTNGNKMNVNANQQQNVVRNQQQNVAPNQQQNVVRNQQQNAAPSQKQNIMPIRNNQNIQGPQQTIYSGKGRPRKTDASKKNYSAGKISGPTRVNSNFELNLNGLKYITEEVIKNG